MGTATATATATAANDHSQAMRFLILATLISAALAALPMEPDAIEPEAILNDLVNNDVQVSGGSCKAVCYKDKCQGTWSNPVPRGKKWHTIKQRYKGGCCFLGHGKCDLCCSTRSPTPAPSPAPTRTPTFYPSPAPTHTPTDMPTTLPPTTNKPSFAPTHTPTNQPTPAPTHIPTADPTFHPTRNPTPNPTDEPTTLPPTTNKPSHKPTQTPTASPTCRPKDDDKCLQQNKHWGSKYTCAASTKWCKSWSKDMMRCCPTSCKTGFLSKAACNALGGKGTCTYPNKAQCASPTTCKPKDDDKCLQQTKHWGSKHTCAASTKWCKSWSKDMMRCCPTSCKTGFLSKAACNALGGKGTCTYPNKAQCASPTTCKPKDDDKCLQQTKH